MLKHIRTCSFTKAGGWDDDSDMCGELDTQEAKILKFNILNKN